MRSLARLIVTMALMLSACAAKLPPAPSPAVPAYPDFVFPAVPAPLAADRKAITRHERGWRFLQANDPRAAEREFAAALERNAKFFPAQVGLGYANVAQKDFRAALGRFDRALQEAPRYAPALAGRGDALMGSGKPLEALAAFEQALAVDPAMVVARQRVQLLQLRTLQQQIDGAREAADAGRYDEARRAYERAIAASPESGFLYRDLAVVQRRLGDSDGALASVRRAVALDPNDVRGWVQMGELLEAAGKFDDAVSAYERAAALEPGDAAAARLARARERAALASLPPEYAEIARSSAVTRADLAALLGVRFASLVESRQPRESVLMTDTRGSWAARWILPVVRAGLMDAYPNHTFRPRAVVTRLDLARAVSRVLSQAAATKAGLGARSQGRPSIPDVPASHLGYTAIAQAVAAGVMPLFDDGTFRPGQTVTGEAVAATLDRLEAITRSGPGATGGTAAPIGDRQP